MSTKAINIRVSQGEHSRIMKLSKKLNIPVSKLIKTVMDAMYEELKERGMLAVISK